MEKKNENKNVSKTLPRRNPEQLPFDDIDEILQQIKVLRTEFAKIKTNLNDGSIDNTNNKELTEMAAYYSTLDDRLLKMENDSLEMLQLRSHVQTASDNIRALIEQKNESDQIFRLNNLEISGVPVIQGEDLYNIFQSICRVLGVHINDKDIEDVHRVPRFENANDNGEQQKVRPPAILVRFMQRRYKDQILSAVRARRGLTTADINVPGPVANVYLGDHLSPANKLLLRRARELKAEQQYAYLWIRDCKILMRKTAKSKVIHISSDVVLDELMNSK